MNEKSVIAFGLLFCLMYFFCDLLKFLFKVFGFSERMSAAFSILMVIISFTMIMRLDY